ncbi:MAG TPA: hypothetical protein VGW10_17515 [Solirubrobacteraceae bacterium]|nr:hypothetical protein [Solirubrobacteraceae bacterium]
MSLAGTTIVFADKGKPAKADSVQKDTGTADVSDPDFAEGMRAARERAERLAGPRSRSRREASRTRHRGLDSREAVALARATFDLELDNRIPDGTHPAPNMKVVKRLPGERAIVEDTERGERVMLHSTLPLEVPEAGGGTEPLDLSLERSGGALVTAASGVPLSIDDGDTLDVKFPDAGFAIQLADSRRSAAELRDGRVFFANVHRDADAVVVPKPFGAEIFIQVRSPESPESYRFDVDLPPGVGLRRATTDDPIPNDPPRALEIHRGKEKLGFIYPPVAYDADRQPIESTMKAEGDEIVIAVPHRENEDLRYPLLVDPEVIQWGRGAGNYGDWPNWNWFQVLYGGDSAFYPNGRYFGSARNNPAYYYGLYHSLPTHSSFYNGAYAEWYFRAPANTYVYRAIFGDQGHSAFWCAPAIGRGCSRWFHGISNWDNTSWQSPVTYRNSSGQPGPNPFGPA